MAERRKIDHCRKCGFIQGCLKHLNDEETEWMDSRRKEVSFRADESIFKQGAQASHVLFLRRGIVKLLVESNNSGIILTLETDGTYIGLPVLFGGPTLPYSVRGFDHTEFCMFRLSDFQQMIEKNGKFASYIISQLNDYTLRSYDRLHTVTHKQLHGRLADILICLSERIYKGSKFLLSLSRKDLADISCMSVESVSRIINEFRKDRIISLDGREIEILDLPRLRHISHVG